MAEFVFANNNFVFKGDDYSPLNSFVHDDKFSVSYKQHLTDRSIKGVAPFYFGFTL